MPEANKAVVKGLIEGLWGKGQDPEAAIAKYRHPSCVSHNLGPKPYTTQAEHDRFRGLMLERFRTTDMKVDQLVAEGDTVAFRATFTGTTRDDREVTLHGFGFCRVEGGKVVEGWNGWDTHALATQLEGGASNLESVLRAR